MNRPARLADRFDASFAIALSILVTARNMVLEAWPAACAGDCYAHRALHPDGRTKTSSFRNPTSSRCAPSVGYLDGSKALQPLFDRACVDHDIAYRVRGSYTPVAPVAKLAFRLSRNSCPLTGLLPYRHEDCR